MSTVPRPFQKPHWLSGSKPCSRCSMRWLRRNPGEDLSCYTKERNAFVVVTGLAIALPFVEVYNGGVIEILWDGPLCPHSLNELCDYGFDQQKLILYCGVWCVADVSSVSPSEQCHYAPACLYTSADMTSIGPWGFAVWQLMYCFPYFRYGGSVIHVLVYVNLRQPVDCLLIDVGRSVQDNLQALSPFLQDDVFLCEER